MPAALTTRTDSLNDVRAVIPESCYERRSWPAVVALVRGVVLYLAPIASLALTDRWWLLLLLWPLAGLAVAGLFVLGHDASHGALTKSRRFNRVILRCFNFPRMGLTPSIFKEFMVSVGFNATTMAV